MRHIPLLSHTPDLEWQQKAKVLLESLHGASDSEARNKIIDKNRALWGELKNWLLDLSHKKCWFSEAKDCFSHWEVEHYRPKSSARDRDGSVHEGYWWLAFDWQNFRICGNVGNRSKWTYFPLREGCARIGPGGDLRQEDPLLLDPIDEYDPVLLFFDIEGHAIAAPGVSDEWERARVAYSVERYNLDYPQLMDRRKTVWEECWRRSQDFLRELSISINDSKNSVARDRMKQALKRLREMIGVEQEMSAVARACLQSSGDERLEGVLRSA